MQDTIKGQTQFLFVDLGTRTGAINARTPRALGSTGPKRSPLKPDLATIAEQDMPGFAVSSSALFMTSAKTPPAIVQILNEIFRESILAPYVKAILNGMAQIVAGDTPAQALSELRPEHTQFGKVIKESNIKFAQ